VPPAAAPSVTAAVATAGISGERALADIAAALRRGDRHRILVAGADREIGSAAAALALARVLVQEARVVVVDLAFAAPKLAAASADPGAPGLADLVRGTASFGQIITRDRGSRVHLVPAGRIRDEASRILDSERLRMGIEALTQAYDHVVIDAGAVPIQMAQMAQLASSAVLVATAGREGAAAAAKDRLVAGGVSDVTIVTGPLPFDADAQPAAA
jgi:succinoglycan biosynthesis transport protein ExoP